MRDLLRTDAARGTGAALLGIAMFAYPLLACWLMASGAMAISYRCFRNSFRQLDRQPAASPARRVDPPVPAKAVVVDRGDACDVPAVMAAIAARQTPTLSKN